MPPKPPRWDPPLPLSPATAMRSRSLAPLTFADDFVPMIRGAAPAAAVLLTKWRLFSELIFMEPRTRATSLAALNSIDSLAGHRRMQGFVIEPRR